MQVLAERAPEGASMRLSLEGTYTKDKAIKNSKVVWMPQMTE